MAHSENIGVTMIQVNLDSADSSDWVCPIPVRVKSYGFQPYAADDILVLGEYQADSSILALPLKSPNGNPVGMLWDTVEKFVTPAVDRSACTLSGDTTVIIVIDPL